MINQMDRRLTILADGERINGFARAKLTGTERLGLYPSLFMLDLWNLSEEDYLLLSRCRGVTVKNREAVLVSGIVSDAFRESTKKGTEAHIAISPGLDLWEANVSVSMEAGVSVSETVRQLLEASGTGIPLLSFPGEDPVSTRGQAFFGRAAECIEEALGKVGAGCCLVPSGLCVIPKEGLPVSMVLTGEDLTDVPAYTSGGEMVLRTEPAGWTLGKGVEVRYGRTRCRGLITERMLNLDMGKGPWRVELVVHEL